MPPSIDHMLVQPCTVITITPGASRDEYGDEITEEVRTDTRCLLQQSGSEQTEDNGQISTWKVFLPAQFGVTGWDAIEVEGMRYTLTGDADPVISPLMPGVHHVEAVVQRHRP